MAKRTLGAGLILILAGCQEAVAPPPDPAYRQEIERWRADREARLKSDGGWLTVAGLHWLREGLNTFGSAPGNDFVLPASAPPKAGAFEFHSGQTRLQVEPGVTVMVEGNPVSSLELRPDTSKAPTILTLGPLTMQVIQREDRYGVRLKDNDSPRRRDFAGLDWYPIREEYRIDARFVPHDQPQRIPIPNVLGQVKDMTSPGYAVFDLKGQEVRLHPVLESPEDRALFFIFRDATAPEETYGAGRFLYSDLPQDGRVELDFNKAYSPPCAFTDFATCPLPPKENRLAARIEAGEKKPPGH